MDSGARQSNSGFSFVELLFAMVLVVACSSLIIVHAAMRYSRDTSDRNRLFAYRAAKTLLADVHAAASEGEDIRALDDGGTSSPNLSLRTGSAEDASGNEAHGNFQTGGDWVWWRTLRVRPVPGIANRGLHKVSVTVSKRVADDSVVEVATMETVVATPLSGYTPTQVFDLYLLAIENIAGRGVDMGSMQPFVESIIDDFERGNPGIRFRTHWITKASYGRDAGYTPDFAGVDGTHVYRYADAEPETEGAYRYEASRVDARVTSGGEVRNARDPNSNPVPYALADVFNHGMRLADERALHERRIRAVRARKRAIADALARDESPPADLADMSEEPTLRLFLEGLNSDPDRYRNALVLNLHGDALPMPAIRNFADPAADPRTLPGLRCVAHPEELRTRRDPRGIAHDPIVLRVYAYSDRPDADPPGGICPPGHAITLRIEGVDLTDPGRPGLLHPAVDLDNLYGGVPIQIPGADAPTSDYRPFARAKDIYQPRAVNEMFYFAQFVDPGFGEEKYSLVWLFNTPVNCPPVRNSGVRLRNLWRAQDGPIPHTETQRVTASANPTELLAEVPARPTGDASMYGSEDPNKGELQGLDRSPESRLYNLEYVPSPTGLKKDFSRDLSAIGSGPKNTARWRLTIRGAMFEKRRFVTPEGRFHDPQRDVCLAIKTSFWKPGDAAPKGSRRISTTYAWWASSREAVPATERWQFLGDPRHCPYKDLGTGDVDFDSGYNWYFDGLRQRGTDGAAGYPTLDAFKLRNGWLGGHRFDVPRYLSVLREGLLRSGAVFGSIGSFGSTRVLLGGESSDDTSRLARENRDSDSWWSRPWLGELCPDPAYDSRWNLYGGALPEQFSMVDAAQAPVGSKIRCPDVSFAHDSSASRWSWQTFFNAQSGRRGMDSFPNRSAAVLSATGERLLSDYRVSFPRSMTAAGRVGWMLSGRTPEWAQRPYVESRCRAKIHDPYWHVLDRFAELPGGTGAKASNRVGSKRGRGKTSAGSAIVDLFCGSDRARIAVNCFGTEDLEFRVRFSLVSLLDGLVSTGVGLPPLLEILEPKETDVLGNPAELQVRWDLRSDRWDGQDHRTSVEAVDEVDLCYTTLFSRDSGRTWRHLADHSPAELGAMPRSELRRTDAGIGAETSRRATPAFAFPSGEYLIRVEAYEENTARLRAHHTRRIEIVR